MLSAVPDPRRRLSGGILVEASILARVLGIRLLTLDTTVVLVPADVRGSSSSSPQPLPVRPSAPAPTRSGTRHGLAMAVQNINEGVELLARVRAADPGQRELRSLRAEQPVLNVTSWSLNDRPHG